MTPYRDATRFPPREPTTMTIAASFRSPSIEGPSFPLAITPIRAGRGWLLTAEQEQELAGRVARGDDDARDELVRRNLRLVAKIAHAYAGRGLELDDLIGEGNLGLIRAARDYRAGFGTRFSTYAAYWIKQAIRAALADRGATIRLPAHMVKLMAKWHRAEQELVRELGQAPDFDRIAGALALSAGERDLVEHALRSRRLEHGADEEGRVVDECSLPDVALERSEESSGLRERMAARLDERERRVIGLRFGLEGGDPLSLKEVGERMGITREGARKIELRAIKKLKEEDGTRA
jgi:RNA polymerase primary sigma factor